MRRHALALLLSSALAVATPVAVGPLAPAGAEPGPAPATATQDGTGDGTGAGSGADPAGLPTVPPAAAERALEVAEQALGVADAPAGPGDPTTPSTAPGTEPGTEPEVEPTLALRELFLARASLRGADARRADALLARPTDGARDPYDDGYTVPSRRTCSPVLCVHSAVRGADAPPSRRWVRTTRRVLQAVWEQQVGRLDYRRPLPDRRRGGDNRFDVYLKDVGGEGYYGYCAPERQPDLRYRTASGFCVLDEDFARRQFGAEPLDSLRVTAAHEFFHAVQYAYDVDEDRWLFEATATWMEERFADAVDDNRRYLFAGQAGDPARPLDWFTVRLDATDAEVNAPYGNWVFFESLSQRPALGLRVVREVWARAADSRGAPDDRSVEAVRNVLAQHGLRFDEVYAEFVLANLRPGARGAYAEGAQWGLDSRQDATVRVDGLAEPATLQRLASTNWTVTRAPLLGWPAALRVEVDSTAPVGTAAAALLVRLSDGSVQRVVLEADGQGDVDEVVPVPAGTDEVLLAAVNPGQARRDVTVQVSSAG